MRKKKWVSACVGVKGEEEKKEKNGEKIWELTMCGVGGKKKKNEREKMGEPTVVWVFG